MSGNTRVKYLNELLFLGMSFSNLVMSIQTPKRISSVQNLFQKDFLIIELYKCVQMFLPFWTEQICLSRYCQSGLQANALKIALIIIWCITTNEGNFKIIKINYCSSNDSPVTDAVFHYLISKKYFFFDYFNTKLLFK